MSAETERSRNGGKLRRGNTQPSNVVEEGLHRKNDTARRLESSELFKSAVPTGRASSHGEVDPDAEEGGGREAGRAKKSVARGSGNEETGGRRKSNARRESVGSALILGGSALLGSAGRQSYGAREATAILKQKRASDGSRLTADDTNGRSTRRSSFDQSSHGDSISDEIFEKLSSMEERVSTVIEAQGRLIDTVSKIADEQHGQRAQIAETLQFLKIVSSRGILRKNDSVGSNLARPQSAENLFRDRKSFDTPPQIELHKTTDVGHKASNAGLPQSGIFSHYLSNGNSGSSFMDLDNNARLSADHKASVMSDTPIIRDGTRKPTRQFERGDDLHRGSRNDADTMKKDSSAFFDLPVPLPIPLYNGKNSMSSFIHRGTSESLDRSPLQGPKQHKVKIDAPDSMSESDEADGYNEVEEETNKRCIFPRGHRVCVAMDMICLIVSLFELAIVPYMAAFYYCPCVDCLSCIHSADRWAEFGQTPQWIIVTNLLFLLEMIVSSRTAFERQGHLVVDSTQTTLKYLRTWGLVDIFSILASFASLSFGDGLEFGVRMLSLLRCLKTISALKRIEEVIISFVHGMHYVWFQKFVRYICLFFCCCHWFACAWVYMGRTEAGYYHDHPELPGWILERGYGREFDVDNFYVYHLGLQFSTAIFTTNSAVDYAKTFSELRVIAIMQVLSFFFASLITASIIGLVQDMTKASKEFEERNISLKQFLHEHGVPLTLQLRTMRCLQLLWQAKNFVSAEDSLSDLPPDVTADLILHMRACHLRRHRFFSSLKTDEMRQVCIKSSEVFFMEGEELVKMGQAAKSAFFLTRGTVEIESRRYGEANTYLVSPAWFGDLSLFNHGIVRTATVRAVDATSAIEVRQDVISEMSSKFPHMSKLYENFVEEADRDRSAFLNGGLKADSVEEELAYKKMGYLNRIVYRLSGRRAKNRATAKRQRANTSTFAGDPVLREIRESQQLDADYIDSDDESDDMTPAENHNNDNIEVIRSGSGDLHDGESSKISPRSNASGGSPRG